MAVTDPCKAREPKVIDNALIEKCLDFQYPKGEIGRLMRQEGIPMEEIQDIRFGFMHILKIDHLWVLKSLTILHLNNNYIEKIENLETLVNLKELDLSFNNISKIENLDTLVNLEKLCLYENLLEVFENMDTLMKLTIFTAGKNKIVDKTNIQYLRRFKNLVSLNMAHNPCAEKANFREYVAAFLPTLVYYEYKKIDDIERESGKNLFERELLHLHRIEDEENEKRELLEKEKADAELHSLSFVEYLNSRYLFDKMFEGDVEGKAFLEMGEDIQEVYDEYETQFIELCKQVFEVGQKHYALRKAEIDIFMTSVNNAKDKNQQESVEHMEAFLEKKKELFKKVSMYQDHLDNDLIDIEVYDNKIEEMSLRFTETIHDAWKKLMKLELQLFEQIEEVNGNFEHVLGEMINAFMEESQAIFSLIRSSEVTYTENLSDIANRYMTSANLDDSNVPAHLKSIMSDKEALVNALGNTHDAHLLVIDNREDTLVNRAKQWLETFTTNLTKDEIKRNRYKLLEINHFLDIQREEFDDLTTEDIYIGDDDDVDNFL